MKLKIAQTAGFCMGVRRAVELAVDTASKNQVPIFTLGPLIHNNQTLEVLKDRGVRVLQEDETPHPPAKILVRAHGVPPEMQSKYETDPSYDLIDGTCPKVKTVHKVIEKYRSQNYAIVITGDQGHAEVIGLMGYAAEAGYLIQDADDVEKLPDFEKVCLVSQTTFNRHTFDAIADALKKRYQMSDVVIKKTICAATDKRQEETRELARAVDAMIVVGGKNSANTLRLVSISQECNTPTQHIETEQEIEWAKIQRYRTIGVTAGASTPSWMIKRVTDHIRFLDRKSKTSLWGRMVQFLEKLANINFFVAVGGVTMYYASSILQGFPAHSKGAVLSFLYLMSIYLWNSLTCTELNKHLDISRYRFYNDYKRQLTIVALACIAILLGISLVHNFYLFSLMFISTIAGSVYHFTIVPPFLRKYIKYSNLKDIPTSRDLFTALAWAVLITLLPHAIHTTLVIKPATIALFLWIFYLSYLRSLFFDLRDIEGDRILGRETLVTIVGEKSVRRLIYMTLVCSFTFLIGISGFMFIKNDFKTSALAYAILFQLPVLLHLWLFMKYHRKFVNAYSVLFNIFGDGQFYLAGLGAWIARLVA